MTRFRIVYVNPAFTPRPSYFVTDVPSAADAVDRFWAKINPACVLRSVGDGGIVRVERRTRTPRGKSEWIAVEGRSRSRSSP